MSLVDSFGFYFPITDAHIANILNDKLIFVHSIIVKKFYTKMRFHFIMQDSAVPQIYVATIMNAICEVIEIVPID
jgi:hypothetical protein